MAIAVTSTRPPFNPRWRLWDRCFRGWITRLLHWLSTLRRDCYRPTAQDSLRLL